MYNDISNQVGRPEPRIIPAGLTIKKSDGKSMRNPRKWQAIPEALYFQLATLGRAKYRAIVAVTYMALLWDGWTSRKKTKRQPSNEVMITRRMLAAHFQMPEATGKRALSDLVKNGTIVVSRKSVYSGKSKKNLGAFYRLPLMEKDSGGKHLKVYWGLLVSNAFLALSVPAQAIIILLHSLHNRKQNRLTIQPYALTRYGIHRTTLPAHIAELRNAELLIHIDDFEYSFGVGIKYD